jgi:hypothetical protein
VRRYPSMAADLWEIARECAEQWDLELEEPLE